MPEREAADTHFLTGVPYLDEVLGGGIARGALVVVIGAPGTGKTVLAQHIAFAAARRGEAVLYCTGFSESHDKLVGHNRGFAFFDEGLLGRRIQLESLTDLLAQGPRVAEDAIATTAAAQGASLVVLDGFTSMRRALSGEQEVAQFLHSLGAKLSHLGATTLVALEGDADQLAYVPELVVCDVILSLRRQRHGSRHLRFLEILKTRGTSALGGVHSFTIDGRGVAIAPRLESLVERDEPPWSDGRAAFGIEALDTMLDGGITVGTTTLAAGNPGAGKTLLALSFLAEGIRRGESGLYVGFLESADQARAKARSFHLGLDEAETAGSMQFLVFPGYDIDADEVASAIRADVERRGVRRLVIDSVTELLRGVVDPGRPEMYLAALVASLRRRHVTTVATLEVPTLVSSELRVAAPPLSVLAENVLLLRHAEYQGALLQMLSVVTMRFSAFDRRIWEYAIEPGAGIRLLRPVPPAAGYLIGLAQPLATAAAGGAEGSHEASP